MASKSTQAAYLYVCRLTYVALSIGSRDRIGLWANYLPKGRDRMVELGRTAGRKSGGARRRNALLIRMFDLASVWAKTGGNFTPDQVELAMRPKSMRGGNHDTDWRCPKCHHFNSIQRRMCAQCFAGAPKNGRLTKAALREKAAEHRTAAILREYGL